MTDKIRWGILGAGAIARAFAAAAPKSATGQLVAVADRITDQATKLAAEFGIPRRHSSCEALLADKDVQAVYIATPHSFHAEWVIKAAQAGKHILCEKPFALNHADALAAMAAARANGVFLVEGFMYRCHPQTAKLIELLRAGAIGEVRMIQATYSFQTDFAPASRLFDKALGGGGILDVGGYPVSLARLLAGIAADRNFADPVEVKGVAHLGQTGVDEWAAAVLKFPGDIVAQVATGITVRRENNACIFGSTGHIVVPNPWLANRQAPDAGRILVYRQDQAEPQDIAIPVTVTSYTFEIDMAGRAIGHGKSEAPPPAMTWDDTLGNLRTLDLWRQSIGLVYAADQSADRRPSTQ